jgi:hypothetical protein
MMGRAKEGIRSCIITGRANEIRQDIINSAFYKHGIVY